MGKLVLNGVEYIGGGSGGSDVVKQSKIDNLNNYRVILSKTDSDNEETAPVNKSPKLTFNPKIGKLHIGKQTLDTGEHSSTGTIELHYTDEGSNTTTLISPTSGITTDSYGFDIVLTNDTWDGTNNSLKDAIASGGSTIITYEKTITTNSHGWWAVEDKDGNILDPETYLLLDVSVRINNSDGAWNAYGFDWFIDKEQSETDYKYLGSMYNINTWYRPDNQGTYTVVVSYRPR